MSILTEQDLSAEHDAIVDAVRSKTQGLLSQLRLAMDYAGDIEA